MKDKKYFTSDGKFTSNENLAYTYESKDDAQQVAEAVEGVAIEIDIKTFLA